MCRKSSRGGLANSPAGDDQAGRERGFGFAEGGESCTSHFLVGLRGAGDDDAGEVWR